jgi:Flp pilus assembly protein TadD
MRVLVLALLPLTAAWAQQEATPSPASPAPSQEARRTFDAASKAAKANRTAEAIQGFEKAVELSPVYAEAWCELGRLQALQKQPGAARKSFESAIQASPNSAPAYLELAAQEYAAQDWKGLAQITGRLIQLRPADYPRIYQFNAIANLNLRNPEAAEKSAREAERLDPSHKFPATWHVLGTILASRGNFAGAAEQFREYLKLVPGDPDNGATRRLLAELERRAGPAPAPGEATFHSESSLVLVRFQVSPKKGALISDLRAEDIQILEDGAPQKVALFEGGRFYPRSVPLEITLLFDCSGSVQNAGSLDPNVFGKSLLDEYVNTKVAIYAFADELTRLTTPTRDGAALVKALGACPRILEHKGNRENGIGR